MMICEQTLNGMLTRAAVEHEHTGSSLQVTHIVSVEFRFQRRARDCGSSEGNLCMNEVHECVGKQGGR